jgi:hypothetical protein
MIGALPENVCAGCDKALKDGRLIWIANGQLTGAAVYNMPDKPETRLIGLDLYRRDRFRRVTTDRSGNVVGRGEPFAPHDVPPFK